MPRARLKWELVSIAEEDQAGQPVVVARRYELKLGGHTFKVVPEGRGYRLLLDNMPRSFHDTAAEACQKARLQLKRLG